MDNDNVNQERQLRQTREQDQARQAEQRRFDDESRRLEQDEDEARLSTPPVEAVNHSTATDRASAGKSSCGVHQQQLGQAQSGRACGAAPAPSTSATRSPKPHIPGKRRRVVVLIGGAVLIVAALVYAVSSGTLPRPSMSELLGKTASAPQPADQPPGELPQVVAQAPLAAPLAADPVRGSPSHPEPEEEPPPPGAKPTETTVGTEAPAPAPASAPDVATRSHPALAPPTELASRLEAIEAMLADIQAQLKQGVPARPVASSAMRLPQGAVGRSRRIKAPVAVKEAHATAVAADTAARRGAGALLAVDVWGGIPSVVVGTGDAADRRVRVLRPGDTYNGVSLLRADPHTGQATFGAGIATFTMSVQDGG
jgi:hypothetical protein